MTSPRWTGDMMAGAGGDDGRTNAIQDDVGGLMSWTRGCTAVVLAALWFAPAAAATDPARIYTDFGLDGKLSCKYSPKDLEAALHDATLNEYGDPYTIAGLKLAIRRQLAGSCSYAHKASGAPRSRSILIGGSAFLVLLGAGGWLARRAVGESR
jgi:hypothetical protein